MLAGRYAVWQTTILAYETQRPYVYVVLSFMHTPMHMHTHMHMHTTQGDIARASHSKMLSEAQP